METYLQYRRLQKSVRAKYSSGNERDSSPDSDREKNDQNKDDNTRRVEFDSDSDPNNPKNWSGTYKVFCTALVFNLVLVTGWASAADSPAHHIADGYYHVATVVETLAGTAVYLFGVGAGALVAGPLSETIGRNATYFTTFFVFLCFVLGSALAPNITAQLLFRLFSGLFAAPSMAIFGGTLADLFDVSERAWVWPVFALSPLLGPTLAPIAGGWAVDCLPWSWVDWITLIISGAAYIAAVLFLPETSAPIILAFKASEIRKVTGNDDYKSEHDTSSPLPTKMKDNLSRIIYFTFVEITTVLFGLYLTLLYMLVFGFLEGFDSIFTDTYGFDIRYRYSAFGAICIGILLGLPFTLIVNWYTISKHGRKSENREVPPPESRLAAAIWTSALLPISLFWLGWTNDPNISYWSNLGACVLFGFSLFTLFTSTYHYLIDTYGTIASSAMSAVTFMRYYASGGIVIATEPMYKALGVHYSLTLLGGVAALMAPIPWIFNWKGPQIRKNSKWAQA